MEKDAKLGIRLPSAVKLALIAAADNDRRSMNSMVEKIMADWLTANGYLKGDGK